MTTKTTVFDTHVKHKRPDWNWLNANEDKIEMAREMVRAFPNKKTKEDARMWRDKCAAHGICFIY